jgi:hypothetical protein
MSYAVAFEDKFEEPARLRAAMGGTWAGLTPPTA